MKNFNLKSYTERKMASEIFILNIKLNIYKKESCMNDKKNPSHVQLAQPHLNNFMFT